MNWLRKLFRRDNRATLVLTLKYGTRVEVGTIVCQRCKNYFFAAHMEIEKPSFCAFCGLKFEGYTRDDIAAEQHVV